HSLLHICNYSHLSVFFLFFFNAPSTTEIYTLSLHDALPICLLDQIDASSHEVHLVMSSHAKQVAKHELGALKIPKSIKQHGEHRSEEHTSELQSQSNLVCRLLLEKKKKKKLINYNKVTN